MNLQKLNLNFWDQFDPCYDPAKVLGEGWEGTIMDILNHPNVPYRDKIWAATREGVLPDDLLVKLAWKFACSVRHLMTDERSTNALDILSQYINGQATAQELSNAAAAADAAYAAYASYAAADATARAAARAAVYAAVYAAADAAADAAYAVYAAAAAAADAAAVYAAAVYAAVYAAADAADAEPKKQVQMIIEEIKTY